MLVKPPASLNPMPAVPPHPASPHHDPTTPPHPTLPTPTTPPHPTTIPPLTPSPTPPPTHPGGQEVDPAYLAGDNAALPFMPHHTKCLYRLTPRALVSPARLSPALLRMLGRCSRRPAPAHKGPTAPPHRTAPYRTAPHRTCGVPYCITPNRIASHSAVPYCTAPHRSAPQQTWVHSGAPGLHCRARALPALLVVRSATPCSPPSFFRSSEPNLLLPNSLHSPRASCLRHQELLRGADVSMATSSGCWQGAILKPPPPRPQGLVLRREGDGQQGSAAVGPEAAAAEAAARAAVEAAERRLWEDVDGMVASE